MAAMRSCAAVVWPPDGVLMEPQVQTSPNF